MPLARSIARRYRRRGLDLDDLVQEAVRGLMDAAARYDFPEHRVAFGAYARKFCRGRITAALGASAIVHGSAHYERDPATEKWTRSPVPIEQYGFMPEEDDSFEAERMGRVEEAMAECTGTQQSAIRLFQGLQGNEMSMTEIGERMGLTRRQVLAEYDAGLATIREVFRRNRWSVA